MTPRALFRAGLCAAPVAVAPRLAAGDRPGLDPLIGARIDPGLRLTDEAGAPRAFGDLLASGGTLLALGYHRCENLCGVVQHQLADTLAELPPEDAPPVLFASRDPGEGPEKARAMRATLARATPAADLTRWRTS